MEVQKWFVGTVVATLAGVAFAGLAQASQMEKVTLMDKNGDMKVAVSRKDLKAGEVTFDVTNKAEDVQHEMIVVKLTPEQTAHPDALPYDEQAGKVLEEKIDDRGEVSELDPGTSGKLTLNLKPGTYMLLCNVPGHYKMKMYTLVLVS